jgi:hypothetical protein
VERHRRSRSKHNPPITGQRSYFSSWLAHHLFLANTTPLRKEPHQGCPSERPASRLRRPIAVLHFPHMDKDTKDLLEAVNFIKDNMVTKTEFNEAVQKLDDRLTAVESKIGGIHNRIDDEALKRANLETRVRSVVPSLPPPPERV